MLILNDIAQQKWLNKYLDGSVFTPYNSIFSSIQSGLRLLVSIWTKTYVQSQYGLNGRNTEVYRVNTDPSKSIFNLALLCDLW